MSFLRSPLFWLPFLIMFIMSSGFVGWELGYLTLVPSPIRPTPTSLDLLFAVLLSILLSLNAGLAVWRRQRGSCPVGTKRAIGIGGTIGAIALLCPVCLILPFSIFGLGALLALLAPFVPLLRIIAIVVLITALFLLWPRRNV